MITRTHCVTTKSLLVALAGGPRSYCIIVRTRERRSSVQSSLTISFTRNFSPDRWGPSRFLLPGPPLPGPDVGATRAEGEEGPGGPADARARLFAPDAVTLRERGPRQVGPSFSARTRPAWEPYATVPGKSAARTWPEIAATPNPRPRFPGVPLSGASCSWLGFSD
jgi:hypothetical protein